MIFFTELPQSQQKSLRDLFIENMSHLRETIIIDDEFLLSLQKKKILSFEKYNAIYNKDKETQLDKLLEELSKLTDEKHFESFRELLVDTEQPHVATLLGYEGRNVFVLTF